MHANGYFPDTWYYRTFDKTHILWRDDHYSIPKNITPNVSIAISKQSSHIKENQSSLTLKPLKQTNPFKLLWKFCTGACIFDAFSVTNPLNEPQSNIKEQRLQWLKNRLNVKQITPTNHCFYSVCRKLHITAHYFHKVYPQCSQTNQ